jgi:glycosyltransferase involved in cell wall biosynthesis
LPSFTTDRLLQGTRFSQINDTSHKRNLGLLIARLCDWERVAFLDDDITIPRPADLNLAAGLTDEHAGVGLAIDENPPSFPDNSVVCHAFRDAGGDQGMFVGGGALVVGQESLYSFFPNTYNEDWFFLVGKDNLRPVATVGRAMQRPYDPYGDGRRAQAEELGDCLAEGLFWLFDNGGSVQDADALFWREFLSRRISFIAEVVGMVHHMSIDTGRRLKMLYALRAARDRSERITPELCTLFVSRWRNDRVAWGNHVDSLRERHNAVHVGKVLAGLGLTGQSRLVW